MVKEKERESIREKERIHLGFDGYWPYDSVCSLDCTGEYLQSVALLKPALETHGLGRITF